MLDEDSTYWKASERDVITDTFIFCTLDWHDMSHRSAVFYLGLYSASVSSVHTEPAGAAE